MTIDHQRLELRSRDNGRSTDDKYARCRFHTRTDVCAKYAKLCYPMRAPDIADFAHIPRGSAFQVRYHATQKTASNSHQVSTTTII